MKVFLLLAWASLSFAITCHGHEEPVVRTLSHRDFNRTEYKTLPECVSSCVASAISGNECKPSDATCFCTQGNITATYEACIQASCTTPADQLEGQRYEAHTCDYPYRTRQHLHRGVLWATFAVATLFFAARIFSRMPSLQGSGYSWDDYVIIFIYGMATVMVVATELTLANGSGLNEWRLTTKQISRYFLWTYISEILYNTIIMTTKIAVVLLYLRVWSADRITPAFRITSWVIITILILSIIAFDLGLIFQCVPVSSTWRYIEGEKGRCINLPALTYAYGAVSISYDVLIFFLPIHSLLKLNITWQRKVGVCTVFLVGFLVTIIAIVRLQYLIRFKSKQNATWVYQTISMWSIIEINFSIVATCMPATAGLLQRLWRWSHGQSLSTSTGYVAKQTPLTTDGTTLTGSHDEKSSKEDLESGDSHTDLADCETALAQGEVDGRVRKDFEGAGKVREAYHDEDPTSAAEMLERHHPDGSAPASALVHHSQVSGGEGEKVQISHEPPTQPAEVELQYRDDRDVLHHVTVRDVPEGRMPGMSASKADGKGKLTLRDRVRSSLTGLQTVGE